jgi:hypothetical protein
MRTAELLHAMAAWLESPNNEALLLADGDEKCMQVVAESCVLAAELLKRAAEEVNFLEPPTESVITPEAIEDTAALAQAFDASGDPQLKKMASVLDELLLTVAAPPDAAKNRKNSINDRAEEIRKKYQGNQEQLREINKIKLSEDAIKKSDFTKEFRILEAPLNTRYCPDHPGAQIARVGEHVYQCELDKKVYNFESGYELNDGTKVPGGDVAQQTQGLNIPFHAIFDTREGRLGYNK